MSNDLKISVVGHDILVENAVCTWFGGTDDPMDNGDTASGFSTKVHPDAMGCAIPMDRGPGFPATHGSGIPKLPWLTQVQIEAMNGIPYSYAPNTFPTIDLGPNVRKFPTHYLDLTKPAFTAIGGDVNQGTVRVSYRILGGAKYLPKPIS